MRRTNLTKEEQAVQKIINSLSTGWEPEERETSILFDYKGKVVHLETSYPPTARRWFKSLRNVDDIKWDTKSDTLKITVPWEYCRQADLILKPKFRV